MENPEIRKKMSFELRVKAAELARDRAHPPHQANQDADLPKKLMSFTKGLCHDYETGLLADETHYDAFVKGIESGDPQDFINTPLGPGEVAGTLQWRSERAKENNTPVRGWESSAAGLTFDLQGPDAQAVTMPPAPALGSEELIAEMAEVYA